MLLLLEVVRTLILGSFFDAAVPTPKSDTSVVCETKGCFCRPVAVSVFVLCVDLQLDRDCCLPNNNAWMPVGGLFHSHVWERSVVREGACQPVAAAGMCRSWTSGR